MQRERRFAGYQNLESRYERRPSAWVEPIDDWGPGQIMLAELHAPDETHDNLVAFWRPDKPLLAGSEATMRYRLRRCLAVPHEQTSLLRAVSTRSGSGRASASIPTRTRSSAHGCSWSTSPETSCLAPARTSTP